MTTFPIGVHSADLLAWMREEEQIEVSPRQLHYAVLTHRIPAGFMTACGDRSWPADEAGEVVSYFKEPRRFRKPRKAS